MTQKFLDRPSVGKPRFKKDGKCVYRERMSQHCPPGTLDYIQGFGGPSRGPTFRLESVLYKDVSETVCSDRPRGHLTERFALPRKHAEVCTVTTRLCKGASRHLGCCFCGAIESDTRVHSPATRRSCGHSERG